MEAILDFIGKLNDNVIWGLPMVILMIGTGLFLTFLTKGVIFTKFNVVMRYTTKTLFKKVDKSKLEEGAITPFQAVCTALAATVGTGNIVGVALAIATGGPGAVFWLWISALVGMVIKYCEVTLSHAYRTTNDKGEIVGGPMYYISKGMGKKWLAILFAVLGGFASLGIGASVQANALAGGVNATFGVPTWAIGIAVALLGALIFIGGIKRIATVTEFLVPFMSILYIVGALVVLVINVEQIPAAFGLIIKNTFTGTAAMGGFLGASVMYACRVGMARGVFTHEAGMGSAPIAHASASTDHPARQGLWGAFEVFFDSIVMCTVTALVILTSGLWHDSALVGDTRAMSSQAFENAFTGGQYIVTVGMCLFAFATIIAWYYYGEKCIEYLSKGNKIVKLVYQIIYTLMIFWGCVASLNAVWEFADLFNGLMAVPNLIALIALSPVIKHLSNDFFKDPNTIRPKDADYSRLIQVKKDKKS
ncbi:MAG: sodium:alanine symporter family protein [Oscillospiraceae bacterium]|nr:sodium:alanine symporter family protein [Oscillospiraceae bacterium]